MPEAVTPLEASTAASSPLELLKAVKEVQERRVALWKEYQDAFEIFLNSNNSSEDNDIGTGPPSEVVTNGCSNTGRGCAADNVVVAPISEPLLAQILQLTTQGLIECSHRLRSIQTELSHSQQPQLARLADSIQTHENTLLRSIVQRDQLRRSASQSHVDSSPDIDRLQQEIQQSRETIIELMQEVSAEMADLQAS